MKNIDNMSEAEKRKLFETEEPTVKDYECLDEVATSVITIDALPGGLGQASQKLPEPIEVIRTKMVEVKDGLRRNGFSKRLANDEFMRATTFTKDMIPSKVRQCRDCGKDLPEDRHWHCRKCVPKLPEEDQYLYHGVSGE